MNSEPTQIVQQATLIETELPIYIRDGNRQIEQVFDTTLELLIPLLFQTVTHWLETGVCIQDENGLIDFANEHQNFCAIIE